jgi:ubiquinone/menaquinone biosynthesis C-methylase UbiE
VLHMSSNVYGVVTAVSMTVGRGRQARAVADTAGITASDRVVDVGCGPGTAVRVAARRGAVATGIDPSPLMLRFARWISTIRRPGNVGWLEGQAEKLPVLDDQASVVWAISSVHHWSDRAAGLGEARRVLAPAGRLILAERLVKPAARGHRAHGLTVDQARELAAQLTAAGFLEIRIGNRQAGRRKLVIVDAVKGPAAR